LDQKLDASPNQLATLAAYNLVTRRVHLIESVPARGAKVDEHRLQLLRSLVTTRPRLSSLELTGTAADLVAAIFGGSAILDRVDSSGWRHLTQITLNPPNRLRTIRLVDVPTTFSFLAKLPSLTSLALTGYYSEWKGEESIDNGMDDEDLVLKQVECLALDGPDAFESWSIPEIINRCPSLLHLELSGSSCGRHRDVVNSIITRARFFEETVPLLPTRLKSLSISSECSSFGRPLALSRYPAFTRLTSLEHLHLGLTCHDLDQITPQLPNLRSLYLGRPDAETFHSLRRLVTEGPDRPPLLRQITLDVTTPRNSYRKAEFLGRRGTAFVSSSSNQNQLAPTLEEDGWVASREDIDMMEGNFVDLLEAANRVGVVIEGEIIEALEVLRAERAEVRKRSQHDKRRMELRKVREEKVKEKMNALAGARVWKIVVK